MDYGDQIAINATAGTDFRLGIRAGDFQTPGPFTTRGVQIANTYTYSFSIGKRSENIITYTMNGDGYIPLSTLLTGVVTASVGTNVLNFNIPRTFNIQTESGGTLNNVLISGYEFYDRPMTAGANSIGANNFSAVRPFKSLTSIYVSCSAYPQTITIGTLPYIDVPYTVETAATLGSTQLQILSVTGATGFKYYAPAAASLPYSVTYNLAITYPTADPQTLNGNVLRPVINIAGFSDVPTGESVSIWYATDNYQYALAQAGNTPQLTWENPYPNDIDKVIGPAEPYKIGWTDWKG